MGDDLLASTLVPLWLKVVWTAMALAVFLIYWRHKGPANFLWFSDIAMFALVAGLWLESSHIFSLTACMVLVPEILWNVSFFSHLLRLPRVIGIADYMFDKRSPLWLRAVSLFHIPLLAMIVWGPWRLGYDAGLYPTVVLITWIVLLLSRWLTNPQPNINHVYQLPMAVGRNLTPLQHMLLMLIAMPLVLQLPGHLLLSVMFGN